jgi:hypothetical protein
MAERRAGTPAPLFIGHDAKAAEHLRVAIMPLFRAIPHLSTVSIIGRGEREVGHPDPRNSFHPQQTHLLQNTAGIPDN